MCVKHLILIDCGFITQVDELLRNLLFVNKI